MGSKKEDNKKQVRRRVKKVEPAKATKNNKKEQVKINDEASSLSSDNKKAVTSDNKKVVRLVLRILLLLVEVIVLALVILFFIHIKNKLKNEDYSNESTFSFIGDVFSSESDDEEGNGGVNVDNDKFGLLVTKLQLTDDIDGNPAACLFFTFTNKTSEELCMSEVFPPSVMQNDVFCETFAVLAEPPEQFYNKDTKIADGNSIEVCYTVKLQDKISPVTLTIHDNYEKFKDIGSVVIDLVQ